MYAYLKKNSTTVCPPQVECSTPVFGVWGVTRGGGGGRGEVGYFSSATLDKRGTHRNYHYDLGGGGV